MRRFTTLLLCTLGLGSALAQAPGADSALQGEDLSALFGIDLPEPTAAKTAKPKSKPAPKPKQNSTSKPNPKTRKRRKSAA